MPPEAGMGGTRGMRGSVPMGGRCSPSAVCWGRGGGGVVRTGITGGVTPTGGGGGGNEGTAFVGSWQSHSVALGGIQQVTMLLAGEIVPPTSAWTQYAVTLPRTVVYLLGADKCLRPLPSRLRGVNQPVMRSSIEASEPRSALFGLLAGTPNPLHFHDHHPGECPTALGVAAMVAHGITAPRAATTCDRSTRPPSLASAVATAWPSPCRGWAQAAARAGVRSPAGGKNYSRHDTEPAAAACRPHPCRGW